MPFFLISTGPQPIIYGELPCATQYKQASVKYVVCVKHGFYWLLKASDGSPTTNCFTPSGLQRHPRTFSNWDAAMPRLQRARNPDRAEVQVQRRWRRCINAIEPKRHRLVRLLPCPATLRPPPSCHEVPLAIRNIIEAHRMCPTRSSEQQKLIADSAKRATGIATVQYGCRLWSLPADKCNATYQNISPLQLYTKG